MTIETPSCPDAWDKGNAMRSIRIPSSIFVVLLVTSGAGQAGQQPPPLPPPPPAVPFEIPLEAGMWTQADPMVSSDVTFEMVAPPMGMHGEPIKDAPYSAEAITEMVQTLADGNRIARQSTVQIFRDGSGRIRREGGLAFVGPLAGANESPRLVSISDPATGVTYLLDPDARTARKMTPPRFVTNFVKSATARGEAVNVMEEAAVEVRPPGADGQMRRMALRYRRGVEPAKPVVESLGQRILEGVEVEGTRSTVVIPAGQIGNEQPINIVAERWVSPALKVLVESRRSDPRFGETTYRLTGIVRAEPAPSLFEVPADYRIIEDQPDVFFKHLGPPPPPPPAPPAPPGRP